MSTVKDKLKQLRGLMKQAGMDAYYIPSTDPHQSEYVPACWQRRQWLSGFTGSAGDLVITHTSAGLWTDGRYFLQAARELAGSTIKLFKMGNPGVPTIPQWLAKNTKPAQVLGADPRVLSPAVHDELTAAVGGAGGKLKLLERNLVDSLWGEDQPRPSDAPLEVLSPAFAGESTAKKLGRLRKELKVAKAEAHVLTSLDAIAWLFNIRSADVDHNPVAIAYAIVTAKVAMLFTDPRKLSPKVVRKLGARVQVLPYTAMGKELAALNKARGPVWVDGQTSNVWVTRKLKGCKLINRPSPITRMKARKNATEVAKIKTALRRDGVAMVKFLCWLEQAVPAGGVTEVTVEHKLEELRGQGENFRGTSFGTIAGYNEHGAIIHYEATEETAFELKPAGILLVDSGGQYLDGTTDITRTVLLGDKATDEQRDRNTRVLQGHIDLARTRFPAGTVGKQLDTIARAHLWEAGLNYNHGTGHGVGFYLNVHEGPQAISPTRCTGAPLEQGNLLSNEPGYYAEGQYGIRIENLVLVVDDPDHGDEEMAFLQFETVTLCPIDTRLVNHAMLTKPQRQWLNDYHKTVRKELIGELNTKEARWLRKATKAV